MFYSYTGGEHKNMLVRFPLKINASSSCFYLSQSSIAEKRHGAMQKLFIKEEKKGKKKSWKNGQVSEIFKTMGTQMPAWKKEMNKIALVL